MFATGGILFILSGLIVLGSDRFYRKGKIKDLKTLLKVKVGGLGLTVIATILMIYGK